MTQGRLLKEGLRILDIPPLRIFYSVSEADRMVEVALVRALNTSIES